MKISKFYLATLILFLVVFSLNVQVFASQTTAPTLATRSGHHVTVMFPGEMPADVASFNSVNVQAVVPDEATSGNVTVSTNTGLSNGVPFMVGSASHPDATNIGTDWATVVSGTLTTNTTWDNNILVAGDITVTNDITLTIMPGVTIFFAANSDSQASGAWTDKVEMEVFGTIMAQGTEEAPIYFTSNATEPATSDWGNIRFHINSTHNMFEHCLIQYAEYGLHFNTLQEGNGEVSGLINQCTFQNNTTGIHSYIRPGLAGGTATLNLTVTNSLFQNNTNAGLYSQSATGTGTAQDYSLVENNLFYANDIGLRIGGGSWAGGNSEVYPHIRNNTFQDNTVGLNIIASGSSDSSGSDTDVQPIIEHNLFDNEDTNLHILLNPQGEDGTQVLHPVIRYNTIRNGVMGLVLEENEAFNTFTATITANVFYGANMYAINNISSRDMVATQNFWGALPTQWDMGVAPHLINGSVDVSDYFNSSSPPLLTRIESAQAMSGDIMQLHGAFPGVTSISLPVLMVQN